MYIGFDVSYPLTLPHFNGTWICSADFQNTQISEFMEILLVGDELFHADGQTDKETGTQIWRS